MVFGPNCPKDHKQLILKAFRMTKSNNRREFCEKMGFAYNTIGRYLRVGIKNKKSIELFNQFCQEVS